MMLQIKNSFASDNYSGTHPDVMEAMIQANGGHVRSYGDDPYTSTAIEKFKQQFGENAEVFFVFTGTAANVLALKAVTQPYHSIICAESAHVHVDECGAPERFTGCKLLTVPTKNGKLTVAQLKKHLKRFGDPHHSQPRAVTITQNTELGTVYTLDEIKEIVDFTHENDMILHMDGSRLSNAAASLNVGLKELTADLGVDVLSFGGSKNGMMYGEAVIFFNQEYAKDFQYIRKQGMQLGSKQRFIAAQFNALLTNERWFKNAHHANLMAKRLATQLKQIPAIKITQKVESNVVFASMEPALIYDLQKVTPFYIWDEEKSEVRWMTSFDTSEEDVDAFVKFIRDYSTR
ncbi:L-threonine aldolase [Seinonella peptonophila]|uniref:L-threonine aldolase n=1 Tax=Seinonella peptonophila TaxID=112248 RepID=A0A1M4SWL2_9BACL|nr:low specificity L-threonine aldolase [Seinonella peptonophila]SHE36581.1 L-threonine aldolase [Seinonella peptonophila]